MSTRQAYPLSWPPGFPRAKQREGGAFRTTLPAALDNVRKSLDAFAKDSGKKLENLVLSSNVTLGANNPIDPGVAAWFTWDGLGICVAVDRYNRVEANLQAIHHIIEARRTELRHGTLALVRATFAGFLALPSSAERPWSEVLGVTAHAPTEEVKSKYRSLAFDYHPDRGGNPAKMAELNKAYSTFERERGLT